MKRKRLVQDNARTLGMICEINSPGGGATHYHFYASNHQGYLRHLATKRGLAQAEQFIDAVRLGWALAEGAARHDI